MKKIHDIQSITFTKQEMILTIDNRKYQIPLSMVSSKLVNASEVERNLYQISPSGYGIHWLVLDEDLSVDGLIKLANSYSTSINNQ